MTKPLKPTTHLWPASPPSFHDAYQTLDSSGRLSTASSPTRSPMTPMSPLRPMGSGGISGDIGSGFGSPSSKGAQFTIIANVPYDTVRQDLVTEFRKFGRVELAMVVCDEASRHPHKEWTSTAGYAFVRFSKRGEAAAAIQAATMGLITIRGTRVRADWARKDSYAKRGRVSAAQGAPSLGPYGIPDGITMLHDTLSANRQQPIEWDLGTAGDIPMALRLPDMEDFAHLGGCDSSLSARLGANEDNLEAGCSPTSSAAAAAVFESLAQALTLGAQSHSEMNGSENDNSRQGCELMDIAIGGGSVSLDLEQQEAENAAVTGKSPLSALIAAEKLCTQLVDLLSDETSSRRVSGTISTSSSSSSDTSSLPHPELSDDIRTPYVDYYPGAPLKSTQIAELLSPTSRGLLSFALSDVVTPNAFPPDVSPICRASSSRHHSGPQSTHQMCSPEDLLKLAVSKLPNVCTASCSGIGDESAQTKTGSSSHRSSTSDEADSSSSASAQSDGEVDASLP